MLSSETRADGTVLTFASCATFLASVLLPNLFNISLLGPMKVMPLFSHFSASSGLSDKKP